ncbi:MAG TPA: energy-coupling factor transporter transmembrane component T [Candidatus Dormibacteraeota bacterium]|nr:energy-coupling factor transporter transmembrane component T [Candidatus Dormibacteraeota bacterium]
MNARAVAAWSVACLLLALLTTNPNYKLMVLAATFTTLAATVGIRRLRRLVFGVAFVSCFDALLNFVSAHLGSTVLFALPEGVPALGGPYTLEALAFGVNGGLTIAAAIFAAAPFSLVLQAHDVLDALPRALSRTGAAIAASMSLVPSISRSFADVAEAQRLRGWKPRGPRSWADVVVPVVLTSAEGSIQLAESMEARGFGSGRRSTFEARRLGGSDWLLVGASAAAVVLFVLAHAAGAVSDWYPYPTLTLPGAEPLGLLACLLLFTPVVQWRRRA